jgi:hypothetical protein
MNSLENRTLKVRKSDFLAMDMALQGSQDDGTSYNQHTTLIQPMYEIDVSSATTTHYQEVLSVVGTFPRAKITGLGYDYWVKIAGSCMILMIAVRIHERSPMAVILVCSVTIICFTPYDTISIPQHTHLIRYHASLFSKSSWAK